MNIDLKNKLEEIHSIIDDFSPFLYTHGYCYIYAKVISSIIPNSRILLSKQFEHCIIEKDGYYFDAYGKVKNKEEYKFFKNDFSDDLYCLKLYGFRKGIVKNLEKVISILESYVNTYGYDNFIEKNIFELKEKKKRLLN